MADEKDRSGDRVRKLVAAVERRARMSGLPFSIDDRFVSDLGLRGGGRCAVSGIAFNDERVDGALVKRPFAASIDQIEAGRGYTPTSVRLVCVAVNVAMNQWGDGPLRRIVKSMLRIDPEGLIARVEELWAITMQVRIDEASRAERLMAGAGRARQRRRLASLRASLTKGRAGLTSAAAKAVVTRRAVDRCSF